VNTPTAAQLQKLAIIRNERFPSRAAWFAMVAREIGCAVTSAHGAGRTNGSEQDMSFTVSTVKLIDALTDALQTASGYHGGIHLATHRAPYREEPGDVDLLVATSTTGTVLGHTWIPIDGHLTTSVWPIGSTRTALAVLKDLAKKGENHTVDIDLEVAPEPENLKEGEHPGWIVTVSESAALFDFDTEFQFHAHHESKFPMHRASQFLTGRITRSDDDEWVETPLTLWSAGVLEPLVKVAKRRGGTIRLFRSADHPLQMVQIGDTWLGAAYPANRLPGEPTDQPSIEPVLGGLVGAV
jgi:hypothetical protein